MALKVRERTGVWVVALAFAAAALAAPGASAQDVPTLVPGSLVKFSGNAGEFAFYKVEVPAGERRLSVSTRGRSGNVDLYIVEEDKLGLSARGIRRMLAFGDYLAASANAGSKETVVLRRPAEGTHYVLVHASADSRNVRVSAWLRSFDPYAFWYSSPLPFDETVLISSTLTSRDGNCLSFSVDVPPGTESIEVLTWGGSGTVHLFDEEASSGEFGFGTQKRHVVTTPPSGQREFLFCAFDEYRNVRLRVALDRLPRVAVGGGVRWKNDASLDPDRQVRPTRGPNVPGVEFHNNGTRPMTNVKVVAFRMNGTGLPMGVPAGVSVKGYETAFIAAPKPAPVPLSTGMTGSFEYDVEFTDFRGRTWTRTFTGQLTAP